MIDIDFEQFNEKGLKSILKAFEAKDLPVASVEATNKAKRESGFKVKAAILNFESGQKLLLKAKSGGSIYQVKLNNKVLAIKAVDDLDKAVGEVIAFVKANEPKFLKQRDKRARLPKISPSPSVTTSTKKQLEETTQSIEALKAENQELSSSLSSKQAEVSAKTALLSQFRERLAAENQRTEQLQAQLDALQEAA
jgi:predicted RNase H-like nuclease (RuvC/YqgF family)